MPEVPELNEINERLGPLLRELRSDREECPFVVDQDAAGRAALAHYSGGRDATYIVVSRKWNGGLPLSDLAVTIRYAPFVEGTAIIYDLTDETMQGKARPFVCNFGLRLSRGYALLPFQIEETTLIVDTSGGARQLHVAFCDAGGETIQATLPFELRLLGSDRRALRAEYCATDRRGRFSQVLTAGSSQMVVRSLLTGREQSLDL